MESPYFGWELLSNIIEDAVHCASDLIVAFVHWQMIKLSFTCLGNGDEKSISNEDCGSEVLPPDWNCEPNHYSLRYALGNDVYILTCIVLDDTTCLFNLYNASKGTVSNLSLELREIMAFCTSYQKKKITEIIPKVDVLMIRVNQELIFPVAGCSGCSTDTPYRRPDPIAPPRPSLDQKCIQRNSFNQTGWGIYGPPVNVNQDNPTPMNNNFLGMGNQVPGGFGNSPGTGCCSNQGPVLGYSNQQCMLGQRSMNCLNPGMTGNWNAGMAGNQCPDYCIPSQPVCFLPSSQPCFNSGCQDQQPRNDNCSNAFQDRCSGPKKSTLESATTDVFGFPKRSKRCCKKIDQEVQTICEPDQNYSLLETDCVENIFSILNKLSDDLPTMIDACKTYYVPEQQKYRDCDGNTFVN